MTEPVAVKSVTGLLTAAGVWTAVVSGFALIITAIVKQWGPWKKLASEDRAADFERLRADIAEAKKDAKEANTTSSRLETMVSCMRPAISILTAEVRRLDPDSANNAALLQVSELMAMAAAGDLGLVPGLRRLAEVKGTGE